MYLLTSIVGTWLAISRDLPGSPLGVRTGLPVEWDFVFGLGTSLSAPLILLVTLVGLNIWMIRSPDLRAAKRIGILGAGFLAGMLTEPILVEALTGAHDPVVIAVIIASLVVPSALVAGAFGPESHRVRA